MAEAFDFEAFKKQKITDYKKNYCKPNELKKLKKGGAIFLTKYALTGRIVRCIMIPFKKATEAKSAFEQIKTLKKSKEQSFDKVALAAIQVKTENDVTLINFTLTKGTLKEDVLLNKSNILTKKWLKMDLVSVAGLALEEDKETPPQEDKIENKVEKKETTPDPIQDTVEDDLASNTSTSSIPPKKRAAHVNRIKNLTAFFKNIS